MPIPFRDTDDIAELGAAGFLTIRPLRSSDGYEGALFVINARGEPLEFTYNRVQTPHPFLWRKEGIRRHAHRRLTASLLSTCPAVPKIILCRAEDVGSELFCQDIEVSMPVCRIAPETAVVSVAVAEVQEAAGEKDSVNLFWFPRPPDDSAVERRLVQELSRRGLLTEPFERANKGLDEVYGASVGTET
jgi:hypothetical protein